VFDLTDIINENRRIFLKRIAEEDPLHAALFCFDCTRYLGAGHRSCPDCNPTQPTQPNA
jgi:hypothetical protein